MARINLMSFTSSSLPSCSPHHSLAISYDLVGLCTYPCQIVLSLKGGWGKLPTSRDKCPFKKVKEKKKDKVNYFLSRFFCHFSCSVVSGITRLCTMNILCLWENFSLFEGAIQILFVYNKNRYLNIR